MEVARLSWLAGHWKAQLGSGEFFESWSEPIGTVMQGHGCLVEDGTVSFMEFMSIEQSADGEIVMYMLLGAPSEGAKTPVGFTLEAQTDDSAFFDNPMNHFPTRIEYRRSSDGLVCVISNNEKSQLFDFVANI